MGCQGTTISSSGISYSKICGKIIAYQVGTTDAFFQLTSSSYVDGISLTHGNSTTQHIWTLAAGASEQNDQYSCLSDGSPPPSFVGKDYYCDTGNNGNSDLPNGFYSEPLWDGERCNDCCAFNTPPWFYKQLPQHTTDDIEMRVCTDEARSTEDIAIEIIQIYIQ
jgi:dynein heavy chain